VQNTIDKDAQVEHDARNREVVMLIKLFAVNDMLLEVQDNDNPSQIWGEF
jgi:hypothetical protein